MTDEEQQKDPLMELVKAVYKDPKFEELRKALVANYVFMPCFDKDPYQTAFNEGMREMAAMISGLNYEVEEWLKTTENG